MTLFARYFENNKLHEINMLELENFIQNEDNKKKIAKIIYHRYYDRYIKIFFYRDSVNQNYLYYENQLQSKPVFDTEYKSGFSIMTNCCLLIETLGTFFQGSNKSNQNGKQIFELVFQKAKAYNNPLCKFIGSSFYNDIRCGLLHQGETYNQFKINRHSSTIFDKETRTINAMLFCISLKNFLLDYQKELENAEWDSEIWDNCRVKIRHIIANSR